MAQAAVPKYLESDFFAQCPPGHRFTLYGAFWNATDWSPDKSKASDLGHQFGKFPEIATKQVDGLRNRQAALAAARGNTVAMYAAESTAPFATGTGIEHPLENGMAFLNPYGLPYLPGASVKGVLRRAAQELAGVFDDAHWDRETGWTREAIEALFGKEPPPGSEDASRGALSFWDVIPDCKGLRVEIMNPHYSEYYQGKISKAYPQGATPHDAGNPIPIYFLAVPEGTSFIFHVQCDARRCEGFDWRALLEEAFEHAFDWLGFGAKTAVGYGAMRRDTEREVELREQEQRAEEQARLQELSPAQRAVEELRTWLDEDRTAGRTESGGRLANRLAELMREAENWEAADRAALADLAAQIYGLIGWGSGKKKREKQARVRALRGDSA